MQRWFHRKIAWLGGAVATAALVTASLSASSAAASTMPAKVHKSGMEFVPVIKILGATEHQKGYLTALLANGQKISFPRTYEGLVRNSIRKTEGLRPDALKNTVYGNCGSSYVELTNKSDGHPVHLETGFKVDDPAYYYAWTAPISGPGYSYTFQASGGLASRTSWTGKHTSADDYAHGTWAASATGYALTSGGTCTSGGPSVIGHL